MKQLSYTSLQSLYITLDLNSNIGQGDSNFKYYHQNIFFTLKLGMKLNNLTKAYSRNTC